MRNVATMTRKRLLWKSTINAQRTRLQGTVTLARGVRDPRGHMKKEHTGKGRRKWRRYTNGYIIAMIHTRVRMSYWLRKIQALGALGSEV